MQESLEGAAEAVSQVSPILGTIDYFSWELHLTVQSIKKQNKTQQMKCPNFKYPHRTQPICQKYYLYMQQG